MTAPISDYALLGNLRCAALVSRAGSIDWFCPGKFDTPACFSALLGTAEHGCWALAPEDKTASVERSYQPDTLVLETCFTTPGGKIRITDMMPLADGCHIVRLMEGLAGVVSMEMHCAPRFHYGKTAPSIKWDDASEGIIFQQKGERLRLTSVGTDLSISGTTAQAQFIVKEGDHCAFVLSFADANQALPTPPDAYQAIQECADWWLNWTRRGDYQGRWGELVRRSLIILKALTYEPAGGMVAAPTTSLPEVPGGDANYDYRFCWLRDAAFALKVLINSNHKEEAGDWLNWLLRAVSQHDEPLHALYTIDADVVAEETELPWLPGYLDSRPVRAGNAASRQYQLDIRGELMEVFHLARRNGLNVSEDIWQLQCEILEDMENRWREPDTGIWEFRTIEDHLTHSKVMAWVAYDRCIRDAERYGFSAPLDKWRAQREAVREDILQNGVDRSGGYFTQRYGSSDVDASLLMIPFVGFLPADDPRMTATLAAIERDLCQDGLVRRYRTGDKADSEGIFLACCFGWWITIGWQAGKKMLRHFFSACWSYAMMSGCWQKNTILKHGNCWEIFLRAYPIWR